MSIVICILCGVEYGGIYQLAIVFYLPLSSMTYHSLHLHLQKLCDSIRCILDSTRAVRSH